MAGRFSWFGAKGEAKREARTTTLRPENDKVADKVDHRTAEAAQALIDNPAFERVMERLRAERLSQITKSTPEQAAEREIAYLGVAALDRIAADIQGYADQLRIDVALQKRPGGV